MCELGGAWVSAQKRIKGAPVLAAKLSGVSLLKSASVVSLFTLASRVTGLVRETLIAALFGASALTDAFNVAFRIPNMFRRFFAEGAFSQAFVPSLGHTKTQEGDEAAAQFADKVGTVLLWVLIAVCTLGVLLAPWLVWLMASGLQKDPHGYHAAVVMTRWMFPYLGFISLAGLSASVLNTYKHFAVPAAAPVLLNLAMIASALVLAPWFETLGYAPIYALTAGVLLGGTLQLGMQLGALARMGRLPRFAWRWSDIKLAWQDRATRGVLRLMAPALLGVGVSQISLLINTQIASRLGTGSVTWLNYADRLMEFPTAMLGVALGVVLMPRLSAAKAAGQAEPYSNMIDWGLRLVVLLTLPCAVALFMFHLPLAATLYHYGAYTAQDVMQTSRALQVYGIGLLGLVAVKVVASGYYAGKDIKTPVKIGVAVLVATQLFNLVLVPHLQVAGLALSIGLGALLNAGWLLVGLIRQGTFKPRAGWGLYLLRVVLACALMGGFLVLAQAQYTWLAPQGGKGIRVLVLGAVVLGAGVLYFASLLLMGFKPKQLLRP